MNVYNYYSMIILKCGVTYHCQTWRCRLHLRRFLVVVALNVFWHMSENEYITDCVR